MEINRSVKRIREARHFHGLKFNMKDSPWVDSSSSHGKSALGTYKTTTRPYEGMSLPVFIRLPSHTQCNPVARVQFLKHTFAEHLLRARRALVCWILPQRRVSPSFITCNQWGHRGFHSSRKCAGTPKQDQRASPSVGVARLSTISFTTFAINPILTSDFHFNTSVLDTNRVFAGIKFYLISYN